MSTFRMLHVDISTRLLHGYHYMLHFSFGCLGSQSQVLLFFSSRSSLLYRGCSKKRDNPSPFFCDRLLEVSVRSILLYLVVLRAAPAFVVTKILLQVCVGSLFGGSTRAKDLKSGQRKSSIEGFSFDAPVIELVNHTASILTVPGICTSHPVRSSKLLGMLLQ